MLSLPLPHCLYSNSLFTTYISLWIYTYKTRTALKVKQATSGWKILTQLVHHAISTILPKFWHWNKNYPPPTSDKPSSPILVPSSYLTPPPFHHDHPRPKEEKKKKFFPPHALTRNPATWQKNAFYWMPTPLVTHETPYNHYPVISQHQVPTY